MKPLLALCATILLLTLLGMARPAAQAGTATPAATETATPSFQPIDLENGLILTNQSTEETTNSPKFSEKVDRPVLTGAKGATVDHFNAAVTDIVKKSADDFKSENATQEAQATLPPEIAVQGSFVEVHYEVLTATSSVISIKFNVFWYLAGAAHPNSYSVPLNYDLTAAKVLTLADLFKPGAKYLDVLAVYATNVLQKADHLTFPDGAKPTEVNYQRWNITPNGLQITFDDYQVTPHAVGPQVVVVPYAALKAIIAPDGPLGIFVK